MSGSILADKHAKRFLKALGAKIGNEFNSVTPAEGRKVFENTIKGLEACDVKKILLNNISDSYKIFVRFAKKSGPAAKTLQPSSSGKQPPHTSTRTQAAQSYKYNLYSNKGRTKDLENIFKLKKGERNELYSHLLSEAIREQTTKSSKTLTTLKSQMGLMEMEYLERLCELTAYVPGPEAALFVMHQFLAGDLDTFVNLVAKQGNFERKKEVASSIRKSAIFFHLKILPDQRTEKYFDMMASILSMYLDLIIPTHRADDGSDKKKISRDLMSFIWYILHDKPFLVADLLLQLTSINQVDELILGAMFRKCLYLPLPSQHTVNYVKLIALGKLFAHKFSTSSRLSEINAHVLSIPAPDNFLPWLQEQNPGLVRDHLPVYKKFKGCKITHFLLNDASQNIVDQLVDLICADINGDDSQPDSGIGDSIPSGPSSQNSNQSEAPNCGFYISTKRDDDIADNLAANMKNRAGEDKEEVDGTDLTPLFVIETEPDEEITRLLQAEHPELEEEIVFDPLGVLDNSPVKDGKINQTVIDDSDSDHISIVESDTDKKKTSKGGSNKKEIKLTKLKIVTKIKSSQSKNIKTDKTNEDLALTSCESVEKSKLKVIPVETTSKSKKQRSKQANSDVKKLADVVDGEDFKKAEIEKFVTSSLQGIRQSVKDGNRTSGLKKKVDTDDDDDVVEIENITNNVIIVDPLPKRLSSTQVFVSEAKAKVVKPKPKPESMKSSQDSGIVDEADMHLLLEDSDAGSQNVSVSDDNIKADEDFEISGICLLDNTVLDTRSPRKRLSSPQLPLSPKVAKLERKSKLAVRRSPGVKTPVKESEVSELICISGDEEEAKPSPNSTRKSPNSTDKSPNYFMKSTELTSLSQSSVEKAKSKKNRRSRMKTPDVKSPTNDEMQESPRRLGSSLEKTVKSPTKVSSPKLSTDVKSSILSTSVKTPVHSTSPKVSSYVKSPKPGTSPKVFAGVTSPKPSASPKVSPGITSPKPSASPKLLTDIKSPKPSTSPKVSVAVFREPIKTYSKSRKIGKRAVSPHTPEPTADAEEKLGPTKASTPQQKQSILVHLTPLISAYDLSTLPSSSSLRTPRSAKKSLKSKLKENDDDEEEGQGQSETTAELPVVENADKATRNLRSKSTPTSSPKTSSSVPSPRRSSRRSTPSESPSKMVPNTPQYSLRARVLQKALEEADRQ